MTFENISFFSSSVSTTVSIECCEYSILIRTTFLFPSPHNSLWQQQLEVSSRLRQNLSILNFLSSRLTTHAVRSLPCVCLLLLGLGFQGHLVTDHIFFLGAVFFGGFSVFIVP